MTLPGYEPYPTTPRRRGIGVATLVLGILSIPTLPVCGMGLVVAAAGLVAGVVALVKGNGRVLAGIGMVLSVATLVLGVVAVSWFLTRARECADATQYPDASSQERCIEDKFPFVGSTASPAP